MARPNWEYIRVDVLLPEHPKLDGLSAADKWVLVEMWCYCGRNHTDGTITDARWKTFGTSAQRQRIIDASLAQPVPMGGGFIMHDYLEHNRSRDQIDELSAKRAEAGRKGGQARGGLRLVGGEQTAKQVLSKRSKQVLALCLSNLQAEAVAVAEADKPLPPCGTGAWLMSTR